MTFNIKQTLKNRGAKTAAFVAVFLGPVIGMLYLNAGKEALVYLLITIGLIFLDEFYQHNAILNWETYSILSTLALYIFGAVHAFRLAKKANFQNPLKWYARFSCGLILFTFYAFILAFFVLHSVRIVKYEPFHIPSGSMLPTLEIGDYLLADKSAYGYSKYSIPFNPPLWEGRIFSHTPKRGDIVVFDLPSNPSIAYIKRVIGFPCDTIQMKNGIVYLNGKKLEQKEIGTIEIPDNTSGDTSATLLSETLPDGSNHNILNIKDNDVLDNTDIYTVPEHHYFLMGDNRDQSQDSRVLKKVGYVHEDLIIGKASIRYYKGASDTVTFEYIENK